jgi:transcription elongation factor Elf1
MNEFICPKCGKKSMVQEKNPSGKYRLVCKHCGFNPGTLPQDRKRGVA